MLASPDMTTNRKKSQLMELYIYCTVDMEGDQFNKSSLLNYFWEMGWGRGKRRVQQPSHTLSSVICYRYNLFRRYS